MSLHPEHGKPSGIFFAAAVIIATAVGFISCAMGSEADDPWGPGGDDWSDPDDPDASVDGSEGKGFGQFCTLPAECASKQCTPLGSSSSSERVCTESCTPGSKCPSGGYCAFIPGRDYQCVPDMGSLCATCTSDSNCRGGGDKCLESASGERFCARDCSWDGVCPADYECVDLDRAEAPPETDGGVGDAGDAGDIADGGGAGDAGVADAGDAGAVDGDGGVPSGKKANKYCIPVDKSGEERGCDCGPNRKGATRACSRTSSHGTCWGEQSCDGEKWSSCDARVPEAEICDGIDNNCDGEIDEGPIEQLCPGAPNAEQVCEAGVCKLRDCEVGWTNFPPGPTNEGCQCQITHGVDSNTCATAVESGSVTVGGSPLEISGTLAGFGYETWHRFDTVDTFTGSGNSNYHVSIRFEEPTPNNEFVIEVVRGADCPGTSWVGGTFTHYDWCSNFSGERDGASVGHSGTCTGSAPPTGNPKHCARGSSSRYYLRVSRNPALDPGQATCRFYKISVQASGSRGDAYECGVTNVCEP